MRTIFKKIMLSVFILLTAVHASAYDFESNSLLYEVTDLNNRTLALCGTSNKRLTNLVIPSSVSYSGMEFTITEIKPGAFKDSDISNVTFPEKGIEEIKEETFYNTKLKTIDLPNYVTTIGKNAFWCTEPVEKVTIGNNIKYIESFAFNIVHTMCIPNLVLWCENVVFNDTWIQRCDNLISSGKPIVNDGRFYFPSGIERIPAYAFANCSIPYLIFDESEYESISIGDHAFINCDIEELYFAYSVREIGDYAFSGNPMKQFWIDGGIQNIGHMGWLPQLERLIISSADSALVINNSSLFSQCPLLKKVRLDRDIIAKKLPSTLFWKNKLIEEVILGRNFSRVSCNLFDDTHRIKTVRVENCGMNKVSNIYIATSYYGMNTKKVYNNFSAASPFGSECLQEAYIGRDITYASHSLTSNNEYEYQATRYHSGEQSLIRVCIEGNGYNFSGSSKLKHISFGENVNRVSQINETSLESIRLLATTPPEGERLTNKIYQNVTLYIPQESESLYRSTIPWMFFTKIKTFPSDKMPAQEVILEDQKIIINVKDVYKMSARPFPGDLDDWDYHPKTISWASKNPSVATVSEESTYGREATITAISPGTTYIVATCGDVKTECLVVVTDINSSIDDDEIETDTSLKVFTLQGVLIDNSCSPDDLQRLPKGVYIIVGQNERRKIKI